MGRRIPLWQIIGVLLFTMGTLMYTIIVIEGYMHAALVLAGVAAAIVAVLNGYKWSFLEKAILKNIANAMQALLILYTVGMLIGTWVAGGIIQTMVYYGLMFLNPNIFLVAAALICCVVSLSTGSSWTTAGTVGIALMGIGSALGLNPGMIAGAIITGSAFGDKMSPLSDSTNLAAAMGGSNLFDHVKHMVYTVTPSLLIGLVVYAIMGMRVDASSVDVSGITALMTQLKENFYISPILLIPPLFVILMVVFKIPALPGMFGGMILGCICAIAFQGDSFGNLLGLVMYDGYISETGIEFIDSLLTRGGLSCMHYSVCLVFCAMVLGGVLDGSNMLNTLCEKMLKFAKSTGSLVVMVVITCIGCNLLAADQYVSLVLPGRMFREEFEDRRLKNKNLSRILEDAGTVTSPLIPWTTCGVYMSSTLGVATLSYLPFCFLGLFNPIISIFYGMTGITMEKMTEEEYQVILKQREMDKAVAEASAA